MEIWFFGLLIVLGLIIGSFLTSLTYQVSRPHFSWNDLWRRSQCPKCKKPIRWRDNIPVISYLMLGGRCRACKKPISVRYPLIELVTAVVFVGVFLWGNTGVIREYTGWMGGLTLLYLLFLAAALIAVTVVDLEHQIIPDAILFPLITIHLLLITLFFASPILFVHFAWAGAAAVFFLALYAITAGRGMGLGDVKLAFLIGLILGDKTWIAIFLSFVIGAAVGILLILAGRARFGKPIPFGPFLVVATFLVLLWGGKIEAMALGGVR